MNAGEAHAPSSARTPSAAAVATALGVTALGIGFARLAVRAASLEWDFRVYLAAAQAARRGLDPYVAANLAAASGRPATLPFLYPPAALLPFLALSHLPVPVACAAWVALKFAVVAGLVAAWRRAFAPGLGAFATCALALLGANAAVIADVRSGNVGLVEAGLLWAAFAAWRGDRPRAFAALVVAAATFKLLPAAFLGLVLVPLPGRPARPGLFAAALAALAVIVLAPFLVPPAAGWRGSLAALGGPFPVGEANPSAFALAYALARGRVGHPALVAGAAWLAWSGAVVAASLPALRRAREAGDTRALVALAVGLDLLVSPRPMAYGFALGGGAMAWLVARAGRTGLERAGLVGLLCAQGACAWASEPWTGTLAAHGALIAWAGLWAIYLVRAADEGMQNARAAGGSPAT